MPHVAVDQAEGPTILAATLVLVSGHAQHFTLSRKGPWNNKLSHPILYISYSFGSPRYNLPLPFSPPCGQYLAKLRLPLSF